MHPCQLRVSRAVLGAAIVAALWLAAQALGLVHGVLHAPGVAAAAWFDDHEHGDAQCRVVDQLAHADALGTAAAAAAAAPAALPCPVLRVAQLGGTAPLVPSARGPPRR
jgi:hypothetical protein